MSQPSTQQDVRPNWRALKASACLMLLATLVATWNSACQSDPKWTPYEPTTEFQPDTPADVIARDNAGCIACHEGSTDPHEDPSRGMPSRVGCVECHGGNGLATDIEKAHPKPAKPKEWPEGGANPQRSYALLNEESRDWVRFVNPGDLRVAAENCGGCHGAGTDESNIVLSVHKSLMTTAAHFWGTVSYCNGILPNKKSVLGESYSPEGVAQVVNTVPAPTEAELAMGVIATILPLPHFEAGQTGNIFRVFERGSRLGTVGLGLNGNPIPIVGVPDKFEDPGRPNNRLSDRGLGTLNRVDLPLLNMFKTRLNDPMLSFMGTNDNPGDFRSSGCTACHVVYANDRSPVSSGPYAAFGNRGMGNSGQSPWGEEDVTADPTIASDQPGHPIQHRFTRAIPSSQCMTCHHHQPNSFVNSYLGFTMWSYEADGEAFWPEEQAYPSDDERLETMLRNPEGAAARGLWGDPEFLADATDKNAELEHTQMADYHGHGWMFRAVFKKDREGNFLDANGDIVDYDDPDKFKDAMPELGKVPEGFDWSEPLDRKMKLFESPEGALVHMMDIHAEAGMHCVDCHFAQDVHGNGKLYAEYQAAVEIKCADCHGKATVEGGEYASLFTSGPASNVGGTGAGSNLTRGTTPWGEDRFTVEEEAGNRQSYLQRSMLYKDLVWSIPQVKDSIDEDSPKFNQLAKDAKTVKSSCRDGELAHGDQQMSCYSCHSSWTTACFGCHLPQEANWKSPTNHNERKELRNHASYNPQAVQDAPFMLGVTGDVQGNKIAPVRSSSAVMISSRDSTRQVIYAQVPTIAANGMSSQAFNTHFPHTVRTTETRDCVECHVSDAGDNNAWLAQTYLLGTNSTNFMGVRAFLGLDSGGLAAVRVTEWDEPQAVMGSNLHRLAYPDDFAAHEKRGGKLKDVESHGGKVLSLQLRGEYLYTAGGKKGVRVYDVANVNNKGFSEKIVTQPFSPLGQGTHISTKDATAIALPTNNHISMSREWREENREQPYEYEGRVQNMHELYRYAYVSDRKEGLIVIDIDSLTDFDPANNFIKRVADLNPDGQLSGAVNLTVAGEVVYMCCDAGIAVISIADPRNPQLVTVVGGGSINEPTSVRVQFRYAFVTDASGLQVLDVTDPLAPALVPGAQIALADARDVYVARTFAYVSAGAEGLVIVDVERPEAPRIETVYNADGAIADLCATRVATTNDSVYAYLADGDNGMHVLQLITPHDGGRSAFGYSPRPRPKRIATYPASGRVVALSEGLTRDRAVDESGNQMAIFGRIGGRPLNLEERKRLYTGTDGSLYTLPPSRPKRSPQAPGSAAVNASLTTPRASQEE